MGHFNVKTPRLLFALSPTSSVFSGPCEPSCLAFQACSQTGTKISLAHATKTSAPSRRCFEEGANRWWTRMHGGRVLNVSQPCVSRKITKDLALQSAKSVGTPGAAKKAANHWTSIEEIFVSLVQRTLFLSLNRHDIVHTVKGMTRLVEDPDKIFTLHIETWHFCVPHETENFKACKKTRKSTSCGVLTVHGLCKEFLHGKQPLSINLRSGGTCRHGMIRKRGSRKLRHIDSSWQLRLCHMLSLRTLSCSVNIMTMLVP